MQGPSTICGCLLLQEREVKFRRPSCLSSSQGNFPRDKCRRPKTVEFVTGVSVHAPRQSNSTYIQMVRRYIYETRQTEHPNSTICQYERFPLVLPSRTLYMEYWPDTALLYTTSTSKSKSKSTSTVTDTATDTATATSTTPYISAAVMITMSMEMLRQ